MTVELHHGDCLDVLRAMPDASVDAVVTDPPYGLGKAPDALAMLRDWLDTGHHGVKGSGFMGKAWDAFVPQPALWREVTRVMKPGAHLVTFAGTRTQDLMGLALRIAGLELRDVLAWMYGSGFPKSLNLGGGMGTALKPAYEPVILARKPLIGTVAANVQAHGTGGLNIDACRIGTTKSVPASRSAVKNHVDGGNIGSLTGVGSGFDPNVGRWPANVVLDEAAATMLDEQAGELGLSAGTEKAGNAHPNGIYGRRVKLGKGAIGFGDRGGPSRFFYTSKAGREDRELEDGTRSTHPTVKPVDLMRWLVRLVTPPGGVVLDPFMGSGSTGVACVHERFRFIGIEREAEYVAIARARLDAATRQGVLDL
jgi:site-specific DNA-methyltransferase (adenine-specific)